jgi:hypothetical protein
MPVWCGVYSCSMCGKYHPDFDLANSCEKKHFKDKDSAWRYYEEHQERKGVYNDETIMKHYSHNVTL